MPIDPELNKILKEMWRLDEKRDSGEALDKIEKNFYSEHLQDIKEYYAKSSNYWQNK